MQYFAIFLRDTMESVSKCAANNNIATATGYNNMRKVRLETDFYYRIFKMENILVWWTILAPSKKLLM